MNDKPREKDNIFTLGFVETDASLGSDSGLETHTQKLISLNNHTMEFDNMLGLASYLTICNSLPFSSYELRKPVSHSGRW